MQRFSQKIIKHNNFYYLSITGNIEYSLNSNRCRLKISSDNIDIDLLSVSGGNVHNGYIYIKKPTNKVELTIGHYQNTTINISFYLDNDLVNSEDITITSSIAKTQPSEVRECAVLGKNYIECNSLVNNIKSNIRAIIKLTDAGILIRIISTDKNRYICFGKKTTHIDKSDYIFEISKNIKEVTIPEEILWKHEAAYAGQDVCCSEIIRPSHTELRNVFRKICISNAIFYPTDFQKTGQRVENIKDPLDREFNYKNWSIGQNSELPVYTYGK